MLSVIDIKELIFYLRHLIGSVHLRYFSSSQQFSSFLGMANKEHVCIIATDMTDSWQTCGFDVLMFWCFLFGSVNWHEASVWIYHSRWIPWIPWIPRVKSHAQTLPFSRASTSSGCSGSWFSSGAFWSSWQPKWWPSHFGIPGLVNLQIAM